MPRFTRETGRAAAAKRHGKTAAAAAGDIAPSSSSSSEPDAPGVDAPVPESFHGGLPPVEHADVVVTAPPPEPPTIETPSESGDGSPAPGADASATPAPSSESTVEVTSTPFTPEIVEQFAGIAFDLVGAVTGRPHIWKLDPEEIHPIAAPLGHQLMRIPIIRAIGPDNTELMIVTAGMGVIVTRRLNAHADEVQHEREAKQAALRRGDEAPAAARDIARSRPAAAAAAPATSSSERPFATEGGGDLHIGMRVN